MEQIHNIPPLYNKSSQILILGSFPSVKSREQAFFYGHPQNSFWRVISKILNEKAPQTIEEKKALILNNRIALWDVIASCDIEGSADSSIKNVLPNDIGRIISESEIKKIFVNGKTAEKYYKKYAEPVLGIKAVCLPSTSPANAGWSLERLCDEWESAVMPCFCGKPSNPQE